MFDPADPFDAAALYDMWFNCNDCDRVFVYEPSLPINLDYYHQLGQEARHQGWYAVQQASGGSKEPDYLVLCPHCVACRGLTKNKMGTDPVHQEIAELCVSLTSAA